MKADRDRLWARGLVLVGLALALACGEEEKLTIDGQATPTPTPTPTLAGTPSPKLRSFTATPSTITLGETFTLTWEGDSGTVALSVKGQPVFASGRDSTGSEVLKPGVAGYPSGTGTVTYQAKNSDVALPLEVTVTVSPKPNQSPTVRISAPAGCHPQKWNAKSCTVTCTAEATDPENDLLSYQWSGCAGGRAPTGTCTFSDLSSAECTVTVTDSQGGSATASKTVRGTNAPPDVAPKGAAPWQCGGTYRPGPIGGTTWCRVYFTVSDDDSDPDLTHAVTFSTNLGTAECYLNETAFYGDTLDFQMGMKSSGACHIEITVTDDWGLSTSRSFDWTF